MLDTSIDLRGFQTVAGSISQYGNRLRFAVGHRVQIGDRSRGESHRSAHPESAAPVADHLKDGIAQQPFASGDPRSLPVAQTHQAGASRGDPESAGRIGINGPNSVAAERREAGVRHELVSVEAIEAAVRSHQHVAIVVFGDRAHPPIGKSFVEIVVLEMRAVPPAESTGGADP